MLTPSLLRVKNNEVIYLEGSERIPKMTPFVVKTIKNFKFIYERCDVLRCVRRKSFKQ